MPIWNSCDVARAAHTRDFYARLTLTNRARTLTDKHRRVIMVGRRDHTLAVLLIALSITLAAAVLISLVQALTDGAGATPMRAAIRASDHPWA